MHNPYWFWSICESVWFAVLLRKIKIVQHKPNNTIFYLCAIILAFYFNYLEKAPKTFDSAMQNVLISFITLLKPHGIAYLCLFSHNLSITIQQSSAKEIFRIIFQVKEIWINFINIYSIVIEWVTSYDTIPILQKKKIG